MSETPSYRPMIYRHENKHKQVQNGEIKKLFRHSIVHLYVVEQLLADLAKHNVGVWAELVSPGLLRSTIHLIQKIESRQLFCISYQ